MLKKAFAGTIAVLQSQGGRKKLRSTPGILSPGIRTFPNKSFCKLAWRAHERTSNTHGTLLCNKKQPMLAGTRLTWPCTSVISTPMGLLGRPRFCNTEEGFLSQLTQTAPLVLRRVAASWLLQLRPGAVLVVCFLYFHGGMLSLPQLLRPCHVSLHDASEAELSSSGSG